MEYPISRGLRSKWRVGAFVVGQVLTILSSAALAQAPQPKAVEPAPKPPWQCLLQGDDAKRAAELDKAIEAALKADRWGEAIAKAEELLVLRSRVQGPKHYETVDAEWRLKTLCRVAPMPHEDRVAYQSAIGMNEEAESLHARWRYDQAQPLFEKLVISARRRLADVHPQNGKTYDNLTSNLWTKGKYAPFQPLFDRALEIRRGLFADDHPDTAESYTNAADNLSGQGKYAQAHPLFEKALDINHRLFTDEHLKTADSYDYLASNLWYQGKYAPAQGLFEKALDIYRRLLTDDHPRTAECYDSVAVTLHAQGNYARAQPLHEKALEIRRLLLNDDHPATAISYQNVASNLQAQGKHALAQPLYERALEINRRAMTDNHILTANSYDRLAVNLRAQEKYVEAQPLFQEALEIRHRILSDDHPDTASAYNNLASNLRAQRKYAKAQPFFDTALQIYGRLFDDDHPLAGRCYNDVAANLDAQGKYAQAQPLFEKSLAIRRRIFGDDHPETASAYNNVAANLYAQGKYAEARDRWLTAVKSLDAARLRIAFAGLERAGNVKSARAALAAVQARLGRPAEAWQTLEEDLGRGLLDELEARRDQRLTLAERDQLRELATALDRLDRLVETTPKELDQAGRAKRFEDLKHQRELASIALGEFQTKLLREHGELKSRVAKLDEIQGALPADAALVAWVDIPPPGPNAADRDGEHWGVVVRSRGVPAWIPIAGTGQHGLWSKDDVELTKQVRTELPRRPDDSPVDLRSLINRLRTQRLDPLASALGASKATGLPMARKLIVLPSHDMAGIPVEALLANDDTRIISYAPSATIFKSLRERPRPAGHTGVLALGDPDYPRPDKPRELEPPEHGLLVVSVASGSNAATRGLKRGDVLLSYNGTALHKLEDLKAVSEPGRPVPIDLWRGGKVERLELGPGKLDVVFDRRPAPLAIADERKLRQVLTAARSGSEAFEPLPGSRAEVEAMGKLFRSADRPARILLGPDASEPKLEELAASGELGRFGVIHLATHAVIDEGVPARSAAILTQSGLPDPLQQALDNKPVFDGRLSVREIQRGWELNAELVTLSACETALGRDGGGEGFVGFTQALLMSGARSVCLSLWKVDDRATSLLMKRFYENWLGKRAGLDKPLSKAESLGEAKQWLRGLTREEVELALGQTERGEIRHKAKAASAKVAHPYEHPYYWAGFILVGDPS